MSMKPINAPLDTEGPVTMSGTFVKIAGLPIAMPSRQDTSMARERLQELRFSVEEFHSAYCDTLDSNDVMAWPGYFTADATYRVIARDNAESNLPLGLMLCEGMGMLKDRAYAIAHTEMFAPRYVQHQVSLVRILGEDGPLVFAQANYVIHETVVDEPTRLLQAGRYRDVFEKVESGLLLKQRDCIFDTVMVPNCLVYPV